MSNDVHTVSAVKRLQKRREFFAIHIDGAFYCSLAQEDIMRLGLAVGKTLDDEQLKALKSSSDIGKLVSLALRYLTIRPRSEKELRQYLHRKQAAPHDIDTIVSKMYGYKYLDDEAFAASWVQHRRQLQRKSNRQIEMELKQKGIGSDIIIKLLNTDEDGESAVLKELIEKKRRMSRYADTQKLMQYLVRQGYSYSSVKAALADEE